MRSVRSLRARPLTETLRPTPRRILYPAQRRRPLTLKRYLG